MNAINRLADAVSASESIQPQGRRGAIAASLRDLARWARGSRAIEAPMGAIGAAFDRLSVPRSTDDATVARRRATCGEIAAVALSLGDRRDSREGADLIGATLAWGGAAKDLAADPDGPGAPRLRAMLATAERECRELAEPVGTAQPSVYDVRVPSGSLAEGLTSRDEAVALAEREAAARAEHVEVFARRMVPAHASGGRTVYREESSSAFVASPPAPAEDEWSRGHRRAQ